MKKFLAMLLAMTLVLSMAACAPNTETPAEEAPASQAPAESEAEATPEGETDAESGATVDADWAYIQDKGTLVVGITNFAPMDYPDDNGEWVGFDADLSRAFAESLGLEIEFVEIEWDNKILELDSNTIDCVWNGMTLTDEVKAGMETTNPYCNNAQIVVVPADMADTYTTPESIAELTIAVEAGSAGEATVTELGYTTTPVLTQADALLEVASGTSDACVIDSLMAGAMVGPGTGYEQLIYTVPLNSEEYGVGFRKGSAVAAMLNEFFAASYADGTMMELAEKYGVQAAIIEQ